MYTVTRDGNSICIRATILSLDEMKEFALKAEEIALDIWPDLSGPELAELAEKDNG